MPEAVSQYLVEEQPDRGLDPTTSMEDSKDQTKSEITEDENQQEDLDSNVGDTANIESPKKPWIGYRIEYRNRFTGDLISERMYEKGNEPKEYEADGPIFELITSYRVSTHSLDPKSTLPITSQSLPLQHIRINSMAIINALQSVVRYYPSQDFSGESLVVQRPYPVLVHYYEELRQFSQNCSSKPQNELCDRERDAAEHLDILLGFLDDEVMADVRLEQERNKRGFSTWEWRWIAYKPGTIAVDTLDTGGWDASVVHSVSGGVFDNPPTDWHVRTWKLTFDGSDMIRVWSGRGVYWAKFDGEASDTAATRQTLFFDPKVDENYTEHEVIAELIKNGKHYAEMVEKQCYHYKGKGAGFPENEISGLVMVDIDGYTRAFPNVTPLAIGDEDLRNWSSSCTCDTCKERKRNLDIQLAPLFGDLANDMILVPEMDDFQYLLCPSSVVGYVFRTRSWELLHVRCLLPPQFDENMIGHLVMSEQRLKTLKALSKSFARVNKHNDDIKTAKWSADFVKGKGNGLIFLLHGKPGVGKTCTAECIAEFTRRPLMTLTSSDIGTDPKTVEFNLTENFKRAMSWGAVLLIDEADIFMERRSTSDLARNSLVAGFLRALEFYDGILFLTTNRVGSFDDAFISRIHVQLYYPDFTDEERQKVWKTFIDKLGRERGDTLRLTIDAKEYIESTKKHDVKWNGREIRNAFQTAVALAEYDDEKDSEGRVMVTDSHLRAVIELSKDFKGYLRELHRRDEGKRAEDRHERLDSYDGST
ncbi:ATPase family AAA domain-containing protein 3B 1 [Colletotrichum chlorophyti]|uniref:ATPase family AAA domain-containing protein 3B 1 n=1 Tax=Colletotrichum chlorophyti TaxID=708187 RepID=A0A1Q8S3T1_9PEZI|nr:ATPase family AAA domain-containing protein 3B 1 [Colletotrichum chlorophyti]